MAATKTEAQQNPVVVAQAQSTMLSTLGRLASGISHELNNPLSYSWYSVDTLTDDYQKVCAEFEALYREIDPLSVQGKAAAEKLRELLITGNFQKKLNLARQGLLRIKDITLALSAFTSVENAEKKMVFIDSAIDAALNMASYEIKYRATLTKEFGQVSPIMAQLGQLSQCVLYLVMNAVDSIEPGAVQNNEIKLRTWQHDNCVYFQISDTGRGISPEQLPEIFNSQRSFNTNAIADIGLPICKQIVTELNGTFAIESSIGNGTTVTIHFPVAPLETNQSSSSRATDNRLTASQKSRILVIDDDEGVRFALSRFLHKHLIVEVNSGEAAISLLQTDTQFSLILCDLMMPQTSGIDVHKWVASNKPALAKRLMFISGGVFVDSARQYISANNIEIIDKPFDRKALPQRVDSIIESLEAP